MSDASTGRIQWYLSRLKAMSAGEVLWRIGQKGRAAAERLRFGRSKRRIDTPLYRTAGHLKFNPAALGLVVDAAHPIETSHSIPLPGGYGYAGLCTDWHAGFQTPARWPLAWSYDIDLKQRDDIGDARTNWELNRHRQFVLLAKAYYLTADPDHLAGLERQLDSWVAANPFLWGISWTSAMEMAIRAINWLYTAGFLAEACRETPTREAERLIERLTSGAANMCAYIARHYSRGSSANNHLLVEMSALWLGGACLDKKKWRDTALTELVRQLPLQFASDGVNREMSLHYHAFAMEAALIVAHGLQASGREIPQAMARTLGSAAEFVAHSCVAEDARCIFGDDDNGHILDFSSKHSDYYTYILQFTALTLGSRRYCALQPLNPTLAWLFTDKAVKHAAELPLYDSSRSRTFADGGYTFLRRGEITAVMDHAPLGFGKIAAHGHADALSFQLWVGGRPVLTDPGTYIYNIRRDLRDLLRTTAMHSTVKINGTEQAEILGPFLWGRRATARLLESSATSASAMLEAGSGIPAHTRTLTLIDDTTLEIADEFSSECLWEASFILAPDIQPQVKGREIRLQGSPATLSVETAPADIKIDTIPYSATYGELGQTSRILVCGRSLHARYIIKILTNNNTSAI